MGKWNAASDRNRFPESHVKDRVVMALRLIIEAMRTYGFSSATLKGRRAIDIWQSLIALADICS